MGLFLGTVITGVTKGDSRSLDYSSHRDYSKQIPSPR